MLGRFFDMCLICVAGCVQVQAGQGAYSHACGTTDGAEDLRGRGQGRDYSKHLNQYMNECVHESINQCNSMHPIVNV
jgi:hypothetical protein